MDIYLMDMYLCIPYYYVFIQINVKQARVPYI